MADVPITVYLSLGSNLGDRLENLRRACTALEARGIPVRRASSVYETEPVDVQGQAWFLNCVVEAETTFPAKRLLAELQRIERELGRQRLRPKGPRTIDLDILLYGDTVIRDEKLIVPHADLHKRRFVMEPLQELAPSLELPVFGRTVEEVFGELRDSSEVRRIPDPLFATR